LITLYRQARAPVFGIVAGHNVVIVAIVKVLKFFALGGFGLVGSV